MYTYVYTYLHTIHAQVKELKIKARNGEALKVEVKHQREQITELKQTVDASSYVCMYVCMYACICVYVCVCASAVCMCVCMYVYACVCVCVYVRTYVWEYIRV